MSSPPLYCGQALCRAPVTRTTTKWPLRCERCGVALYPRDVLNRLPASELEPERAELMTERRGVRVSIDSSELGAAPKAATGESNDAAVDRILAMVELEPGGAEKRAKQRTTTVAAIAVVVLLAVAAVAFVLLRK